MKEAPRGDVFLYHTMDGRELVAVPRVRHTIKARVLYADLMPERWYPFNAGSDFSPVNIALGFHPFLWAWPMLKKLPCRITAHYGYIRPWRKLWKRDGIHRKASGWALLHGEISFAHLVRPMSYEDEFSALELPPVGSILNLDAWSSDIEYVDTVGRREKFVRGGHRLPSRSCPWLLPHAMIDGRPFQWDLGS